MTGTGANMRASLTVTADASDVVIEARRGAEAWREFRREVSAPITSQTTKTDPAATMRQDMAERAANANRILAESLNPVLTAERALAQEQQALTRTLSDTSPAGAAVGQALDTLAGGADRASASGQRATETLREMRRAADEAAEASARAATRTVSTSATVAPVQADAHVSLWKEAEVRRSEEVSRAWRALESSLDPLTRASRELASAQELVNAARSRGLATDAKASRALAELDARYQKLIASQRLGPSGDDFRRAVAEDERAVRQLMLALDPAARAQQEFAQAQELVTRSVARGTITQDEAARTMQQLEARQQAVGRAGTSMGLGIQNASYQFTDMIVQLQSGQSAAIALGQQLPQLLGGFGALGAVLGLAAAAGVPLIAMLLDAGDASKSLDDHLQDLETRLGSISDRMKILRDDRLGETFGSMSDDVRALTRDLLALDRAAELKSLQNSLDKLLKEKIEPNFLERSLADFALISPTTIGTSQEDLYRSISARKYENLTGGRGPSYEQFDAQRANIIDLAKAGEVKQVLTEVQALVQSFAQGGPVTDLTDDLRELLGTLGDTAIRTAQIEADFSLSAQATKLWAGLVESTGSYWDRVRKAGEDIRKDGEDRVRIAENELSLAQVIGRYGEDSKQAEAERDRIARENYELELKRAGLFSDQRDRLMEIWDQNNRVTDATAAWADTMGDVRSEIDGIVKAIASIGGGLVERAAKAAELKALEAGATIADAAAAGQKTRRDAQYNARAASLGGGLVGRMVAGAEKWWGESGDELDAQLSAARSEARKRDRSSAGAGNRALNSAASIKAELAKLKPSYEADVAAAEAWRDKALAGLKKASTGYEEFAADVETIFREKVAQAYKDDLERRTDWAAGVERAQLQLEKEMMDWADFSDDVMTKWAKSGEDAFAKFVTTGKAILGDFVDFVAEQFARLEYQQMIQPGLNSLMSLATSSIASAFNIQLPGASGVSGAAAAVPTNHTGSPGVSRSYSIAGYGDRMRPNEQLAMMRQGEEIMTSRALENAGAMISALSALAAKSSAGAQMAPQQNVTVITQTSTPMQVEQQETVDAQGNRQQQFVISEIVAEGLGAPGGAARRRLTSDYGLKRRGIRR